MRFIETCHLVSDAPSTEMVSTAKKTYDERADSESFGQTNVTGIQFQGLNYRL